MTGSKKAVSVPGQIGLTVLGCIQVTFAFLAFWDLAHRDAREVKWSKPAWIPIILVNWIGPASYFLFGIKR
jgi:tetrahydromethanopterin S-methyltransferase subunit C